MKCRLDSQRMRKAQKRGEFIKKGKKSQRHNQDFLIGVGISVFVLAVVWMVPTLLMGDKQIANKENAETLQKEPSRTDVIQKAHQAVVSVLKAPATAKFPVINDFDKDSYSVSKYKDGPYLVKGYVDSQNSFGAMLRNNWAVTLEFDGEEGFFVSNIEVGERVYKFKKPEPQITVEEKMKMILEAKGKIVVDKKD